MSRRPRLRLATALVVALASLAAGACGDGGDDVDSTSSSTSSTAADQATPGKLSAVFAGYEVVAGREQRVIVGLQTADRLVGFGEVDMAFGFIGTQSAPLSKPEPGPTAKGRYLLLPGQKADPNQDGPKLIRPSEGAGVYGADGVNLPKPGLWQITVTAKVGAETLSAVAHMEADEKGTIPGVGQPAPRTKNPTYAAPGDLPLSAIDSRAEPGAAPAQLPAANLHSTVIADAIAAGKPLMVVVSTPVFCVSKFCGPITDEVEKLAAAHGDEMAFVHLEVWRDFEKKQVNDFAKEWIFPPGARDANEPWVFLVGKDGNILQRWDNVASSAELTKAVEDITA